MIVYLLIFSSYMTSTYALAENSSVQIIVGSEKFAEVNKEKIQTSDDAPVPSELDLLNQFLSIAKKNLEAVGHIKGHYATYGPVEIGKKLALVQSALEDMMKSLEIRINIVSKDSSTEFMADLADYYTLLKRCGVDTAMAILSALDSLPRLFPSDEVMRHDTVAIEDFNQINKAIDLLGEFDKMLDRIPISVKEGSKHPNNTMNR